MGPLNGNLHGLGYCPVTPSQAGRAFLLAPPHMTEAYDYTFMLPYGVTLVASGQI